MKYESNRAAVDGAILRGMREGLTRCGVLYQREMKKALNGPSPSRPGKPPGKDTGTLGRSVQIDIGGLNRGKRMHVRVGTNVVYAPIHEFGGSVKAKGGGLTVPIHPDAKRASKKGESARDQSDLFMIKRPGKSPLLARDGGGQLDIMYAMPKRVVIPARPAWRPVFKRNIKKFGNSVRRSVDQALQKLGGLG